MLNFFALKHRYVLKKKLTIPLVKYTYETFCPVRRKWIREQASFRLQDSLHWKTIDEVVSGEEWDATQEAVNVKNQNRAELSYVVTTDSDALTSMISQFETTILSRKSPARLLPQMRSNRSRRKVKVWVQKGEDETRRHWIFVDIRDIGLRTKVFTLQWLSASHSSVDSFVLSMCTEAKNLGISIWQIPTSWKGIDPSANDPFLSLPTFSWPPKTMSFDTGIHSYLNFKHECVSRFQLKLLYQSKSRENCETYLGPNGFFLIYFTPSKITWHTNTFVTDSENIRKVFYAFSSYYSIYTGAKSLVHGIIDHAISMSSVRLSRESS